MFYRSKCCNGTSSHTLSAEDFPKINKATIEALLKQIHSNTTIDKRQLLKETVDAFSGAITKGYTKNFSNVSFNSPDFVMLNELHYNVGVFAAFKNHDQITELVKLLKTDEGKLRTWSDFKKEALKLNDRYNLRWLKVEYDQAITSARAARRWQEFERTKHLYPNLEYIAIQDDRTRPLHKKWHGIVLPIDHVFWRTHYTPNDYGCRCIVRRTNKPVNTKGYNVEDMPDLPLQFNQNVGKTGKVFSNEHPYYKTSSYKQVAQFAHKALINFQRKEIRQFLKQTEATKKTYTTQLGKVNLNNKGVKELLNLPHKDLWTKNNLLYNIDELLKNSLYVKSAKSLKVNPMVKQYHYFLIKVQDKSFYLNVRELVNGEMYLYGITDKIK